MRCSPARIRNWILTLALVLGPMPAALATDCADWQQSMPLPRNFPEITGNVCRLDAHVAYVAGAELLVVDVSDWQAPAVVGRSALPGVAQDLVIFGSHVYVACGEGGVVDVSVGDTANPMIVRSYEPGGEFSRLALVGELLVALDDQSSLHVLATDHGGALFAIAVHPSTLSIDAIAGIDGRLAVSHSFCNIDILDFSRPDDPVLLGTSGRTGLGYDTDDMRIYDSAVYQVSTWTEHGEYNMGTVSAVAAYDVSPDGTTIIPRGVTRAVQPASVTIAAEGGYVVTSGHDATAFVRKSADMDLAGTIPMTRRSIDLDGDRLIGVDRFGFSIARFPQTPLIQPQAILYGAFDGPMGTSYNNTYESVSWAQQFALYVTTHYYREDYHEGSETITKEYSLRFGSDPLAMKEVKRGTWYGGGTFADPNYQGGSFELYGVVGDRAILRSTSTYATRFSLVDASARGVVATFESSWTNQTEDTIVAGSLWHWDGADNSLARYDLTAVNPRDPVGRFTFPGRPTLRSSEAGLLLDARSDHIDVYDASDPASLLRIARVSMQGPDSKVRTWFGHTFLYASGQTVYSVDFTDPRAPRPGTPTDLDYTPDAIAATDGVVVIRGSVRDGRNRYIRFVQIAILDDTGAQPTLSPVSTLPGAASLLKVGDVAYGETSTSIAAFDLSDIHNPVFIGQSVRGYGNLALAGDALVSGNLLLPRDCRDLVPPQEITIDIRPVLKPRLQAQGQGVGQGVVPVAVLGDAAFDVTTLDQASVRFGPAGATPLHAGEGPGASDPATKTAGPADLDGDGDLDLMLRFRLRETGLGPADTEATLTGTTLDGREVYGTDTLGAPPPHGQDEGTSLALSPNPFNPQTTVRYALAAAGPAKVAVYDVRGRRVALLADGLHAAGAHEAVWRGADDNGRTVPSGTYFVRIEADGAVLTRKALLLK